MKIQATLFLLMMYSGYSFACGTHYYSADNKYRNDNILKFEKELLEGDITLSLSAIEHHIKDTANPLVRFYTACALLSNNKLEDALIEFVDSSNNGVVASKLFLAGLYLEGVLVEQNFDEAYRHYSDVASSHQEPLAMIRTAKLLYAGLGVFKDIAKAKKILLEASSKGSGEAYFHLGVIALTSEHNLSSKYTIVVTNFEKAIELGYLSAEFELGKFRLFNSTLASEKKLGFDSILSLARSGNEEAQFLLGKLHLFGHEQFLDKNTEQAIIWLTKVAKNGNSEAQAMLGLAYSKIANSIESAEVAERWLLKAAESNEDNHQRLLAKFYINFSKANPQYQGLGEEILLKLKSK
jgi:TPR repeat protein